ncbi:MAG TPA: YafY family protein [Tepidiformaceae bacterium]|nr:YafY family protein [Tepidiformaceae bacterium]
MRRADRLFQIIQLLRRRHVVTAAVIAQELEVSERTVYRDIRDLVGSGVPIEGEAGVGYMLRQGFDLPPLMFTSSEIEAMVLGARVVQSWGDAQLARAAGDALARVEAALPDRLKARMQSTPLYAPGFHVRPETMQRLSELREAVDGRCKTWIAYTDNDLVDTERVIRPLGLFFWGRTWSVTGWCELRNDFRDFRLDRIRGLRALPEKWDPEPGKMLDDYFRRMDSRDW